MIYHRFTEQAGDMPACFQVLHLLQELQIYMIAAWNSS